MQLTITFLKTCKLATYIPKNKISSSKSLVTEIYKKYQHGMSEPKIHILAPNVVNQIAAGEIVERPAAVVKELVENSLDAKAKNISINFSHGGKFYISVEDDGIGMSEDEILLAIERHATSKISKIDDLGSLSSFGFRGEAIPSISSVAQMTISSKNDRDDFGTKIRLSGGNVLSVQKIARQTGTKIIVENLFFNIPARRKFLKSDETENNHIVSLIREFSLIKNDIKFSLFRDDELIFESQNKESIGERLNAIFKYDEKFIEFEYSDGDISLHGAICSPDFGNICKKKLYIFINERIVKSDVVSSAICEALRDKYPSHREILACLFFKINPTLIDINVHPMKREVRFKNESAIRKFIKNASDSIFKEKIFMTNTSYQLIKHPITPTEHSKYTQIQKSYKHANEVTKPANPTLTFSKQFSYEPETVKSGIKERLEIVEQEKINIIDSTTEDEDSWKFIGHAYDNIFLFGSKTGVVFFDAKSAMSRVVYEEMLSGIKKDNKQILLFPIEISLSEQKDDKLHHILPELEEIGFSIYKFGNLDYKIDAIPNWMSPKNAKETFFYLISEDNDIFKKKYANDEIRDKTAKIVSKFVNVESNADEKIINDIKEKLFSCKNPLVSPSGQAIYFEITKHSIDNRLKNINRRVTV